MAEHGNYRSCAFILVAGAGKALLQLGSLLPPIAAAACSTAASKKVHPVKGSGDA